MQARVATLLLRRSSPRATDNDIRNVVNLLPFFYYRDRLGLFHCRCELAFANAA
jgi:hypothetical protein